MDYEEDLVLNSVTYTDCVPLQTFECNYIIYMKAYGCYHEQCGKHQYAHGQIQLLE